MKVRRLQVPQVPTAVVPQIQSVTATVIPAVTSAATVIESAVPSLIRSAIAIAESGISQAVQTRCSVGTKYLCIDLGQQSSCFQFPVNNPELLDQFLDLLPSTTDLSDLVRQTPLLELFPIFSIIIMLYTFPCPCNLKSPGPNSSLPWLMS